MVPDLGGDDDTSYFEELDENSVQEPEVFPQTAVRVVVVVVVVIVYKFLCYPFRTLSAATCHLSDLPTRGRKVCFQRYPLPDPLLPHISYKRCRCYGMHRLYIFSHLFSREKTLYRKLNMILR